MASPLIPEMLKTGLYSGILPALIPLSYATTKHTFNIVPVLYTRVLYTFPGPYHGFEWQKDIHSLLWKIKKLLYLPVKQKE